MKRIIENLQTLVDSIEFAETECNANYVITTQDKKLLNEALNQALYLYNVKQAEGLLNGSDDVSDASKHRKPFKCPECNELIQFGITDETLNAFKNSKLFRKQD